MNMDNLKWEVYVNNSLAMHSALIFLQVQIQRGDFMPVIISEGS